MPSPVRVSVLLAATGLAACSGTPRVTALHDPLYRAENHSSRIRVRASEPKSGIAQIEINGIAGTPQWCTGSGLVPNLIPCRGAASSFSTTCSYANQKTEVTCDLARSINNAQMITYTVTARAANGRTASTPPVTYAAGPWPVTGRELRIGWVSFEFEAARPVIWRTDAPAGGGAPDKIDIIFMPDQDWFGSGMGGYRAFTDAMDGIARQTFYDDTNQFSQFTRTWRNIFNLWAGPRGADGGSCFRNFDQRSDFLRGIMDGAAIVHGTAFRDCASLTNGGGGTGTVDATEGDSDWLLVHEGAHFLFGLGDEYVGGGNSAVSTPKNVLTSQSLCQSTSTSNSVPSAQCAQIGSTGRWRNDDGQPTTMEDRQLDSDFRTLSGRAVYSRLSNCTSGQCY